MNTALESKLKLHNRGSVRPLSRGEAERGRSPSLDVVGPKER